MVALINGSIGAALSVWIGTQVAGLSWRRALFAVGVSNVSGFVSLIVTLKAESIPGIRDRFLTGILHTWFLICGMYFVALFAAVPELRSWRAGLSLALPLLWSTGYAIFAFGPLQDHWVAKKQRRSKAV